MDPQTQETQEPQSGSSVTSISCDRDYLQEDVVVTVSASLASDNESFVRKLLTKIATNFGCKSSIVSDVIDGFR